MRYFVYTVNDSCSGIYDRPFVGRSDGESLRSFTDIACDADHPIGKHPEHFSLWRVGTFDDNTGVVDPEVPVCIGKAIDLVAASRVIKPGGLRDAEDLHPSPYYSGNGKELNDAS